MTARAVPEISPENLLRIISTRQSVGSVREGVDALERLAMDLDRYGFVIVAESIAYIVRQMDACVEADAETVREALDDGRLAAYRARFKADRSVGVG